MRNSVVGAGVALMLMAVSVAPAGARPGPVAGESAPATIQRLKSEGYQVIESRLGDGPIGTCEVSAIRPGRKITDRQARQRGLYTTVYLDLDCRQ